MQAATGFQTAFLIFAVQFFAAAIAHWGDVKRVWPHELANIAGQTATIILAIALLAGIPALRRYCAEELRRPIPSHAMTELAIVATAKLAIPFAITGGMVLLAFAMGRQSGHACALPVVDPSRAWEWILSPTGLVQMVALSWIAGPIVEELVFRGLLYRAWERQFGWFPSLLLTSACFGAFHPSHIASTFLGSVVSICILRRTGTIRSCIIVHVAFNILVSWPLLGQFIVNAGNRETARLSSWLVELACLVVVAIALPIYIAMSRTGIRTVQSR